MKINPKTPMICVAIATTAFISNQLAPIISKKVNPVDEPHIPEYVGQIVDFGTQGLFTTTSGYAFITTPGVIDLVVHKPQIS